MNVTLTAWLALAAAVLVMLAIDLLMHRRAHVIGVREAAAWSAVWVAVGLAVGGVIWAVYGSEFGLQYLSGYVIEKSLAIDNVFIWALIFGYFAVPREYQHRVLFLGVIGALLMRGVMIGVGSVVIASAAWVLYLFGAFLIWTGVKMLRQRDAHYDPAGSRVVALFRRLVPTSEDYDGQRLLTRRSGALLATPLLLVLVLIEATDLVFAVDSIPAIFAVTSEPFLVFASNAMAILGLRAMYFLLADVMHRFVYLKAGLALVLVWVGAKMIVGHAWWQVPTWLSLAVVVGILTVAIVASLRATRGGEGSRTEPDGEDEASPTLAG